MSRAFAAAYQRGLLVASLAMFCHRLTGPAKAALAWATAVAAAAAWVAAPAAAQESSPDAFSDDDFAYYEAPLNALALRGVLAGTQCSPGRICGDEPVTRSAVAVWLGRAVTGSEPAEVSSVRFADVDPDDWRASHIERLAELGVTGGCATQPLRYCPDEPVTRGQMAALLTRAFDLGDGPPAGFDDTGGHHFESEIDNLTAAGITRGCATDPRRYCPDEAVTRGQMATFIARALGLLSEPTVLSDEKTLTEITQLTGELTPKSIVASGTGLYFAQNVMYRHTISIFGAGKQLIKTLPDSVDLRSFGYDVRGETYWGAPVEAVFTSDGSQAFVSNYRMYGPGYNPAAGSDACTKDDGQRSFVYRIDAQTLTVDRVYGAGPVPKFMAVTHDDRLLLVSNWCGYDVSVIDLQSHRTLAEIEVGRHPRGIAVTGDSRTAYVAVMGSTDIAVIDLSPYSAGGGARSGGGAGSGTNGGTAGDAPADAGVRFLTGVGRSPRHLVLSIDDAVLYATLDGEGSVVALDAGTGEELLRARTGERPRSMDISDDGTALYVVNYGSDTFTKLRAGDLAVLQTLDTAARPIGVTYDSLNDEVWVSAYSGVIHVYDEQEPAPAPGTAAAWRPSGEPDNVGPLAETGTPASATIPAVAPYGDGPLTFEQALDTARRLAPDFVLPVDCRPPPLDNPILMPNAPRDYRSGTHRGVDLFCPRGHPVRAAIDGHVVVAVGDYEDASLTDINDMLDIAAELGATPTFTSVMLNGNYVVVDHGIIDGVGHAVTLYAHMDAVVPALRVGQPVTAGDILGRVGNTGTVSAAAGLTNRSVHLHWELHISGRYLGEGLSRSDTRAVYAALFDDSDR